jgi:hypothetical protein
MNRKKYFRQCLNGHANVADFLILKPGIKEVYYFGAMGISTMAIPA